MNEVWNEQNYLDLSGDRCPQTTTTTEMTQVLPEISAGHPPHASIKTLHQPHLDVRPCNALLFPDQAYLGVVHTITISVHLIRSQSGKE